jgi:ATPase subunit of ABC transporter with duplicated ATPase domains
LGGGNWKTLMTDSNDQPDAAETPKGPTVVLLSDEPSDVDEFEAKAHDQVARSIADLVVTEPGGAVIGLEGTYGSGKSTVVRLASQRLAAHKSPEHSIEARAVIFDAWAHQGDPLRRSFLETVIRDLADAGWLAKDLAENCLAALSGKASTVVTKTTARLSFEGKLTSAAAALLPLGAVLASNHFNHWHRDSPQPNTRRAGFVLGTEASLTQPAK